MGRMCHGSHWGLATGPQHETFWVGVCFVSRIQRTLGCIWHFDKCTRIGSHTGDFYRHELARYMPMVDRRQTRRREEGVQQKTAYFWCVVMVFNSEMMIHMTPSVPAYCPMARAAAISIIRTTAIHYGIDYFPSQCEKGEVIQSVSCVCQMQSALPHVLALQGDMSRAI